MNELEFEYIFVDDGSTDGTINVLHDLAQKDERVHYISFSRNFGKEAAIYAGLCKCVGDYAVIMDADLQDPPSLLPEMYKAVSEEGYDCAATRRSTRKGEPWLRSVFARLFYRIMNKLTDLNMVDGARDFRFMKRNMIDAICAMGEYNRFSKGIFGWVGFKTKWFSYPNVKRVAGKTKWSFWKLFKYSIEGIVAFSTTPLVWTSMIGLVFFVIAFALLLFVFIRALLYGDPVDGWPSTICIITFFAGVQLFCNGIIGIYISKAYLELKNRPIYIVREEK